MEVLIPTEVNGKGVDSMTKRPSSETSSTGIVIPESVNGVGAQNSDQSEATPGKGSSGLGFIYDAITGADRETKQTQELPEVLGMVKDLKPGKELQIMTGLLLEKTLLNKWK
tara:strand:- start:589 stop:924 length:336 start_codon:yes stop_codon:yes gene_type:complete